ncbi:MAG: gamma-glutamyl-gamma-aminobutyrate hydrolase family protein [bacterium]|nr:gamma-glutamyl-gamma-aminobutyrate hydrolase family protein [bacterium]
MKPFIGITTTHVERHNPGHTHNSFAAYAPNITAIEAAGGLPLLIPVGLDQDTLREIYQRLDGLLLPGGGDIDPARYGEARHPLTNYLDPLRDETEITLARWAMDDDLPVLGICRGHQLFNVALGGTLIQDIPSEVGTSLNHDTGEANPRDMRPHSVEVDPESRLARLLGTTQVEVNSLHHQAIQNPAAALCITAYAPDGVIEAAEVPDRHFALTVQWHPEDLANGDEAMRRLFTAFVEAASQPR